MASQATKRVTGGVVVAIVVGVAVLLGVNFWLNAGDAPDEFEATPDLGATADESVDGVDPSEPDPLALPSGEWTVAIDPASDAGVGYRILEDVLVGGPEEVAARTQEVTGDLTLDGDELASTNIEVVMDTLSSDNELRDVIVGAQYLQVSEFPTATFVLDGPQSIVIPPQPGILEAFSVPGSLTLHGQTHAVTIEGDAQWTPGTIEIVGSTDITLDQFEIERPDLVGRTAHNEATIEFKLRFVPTADAG